MASGKFWYAVCAKMSKKHPGRTPNPAQGEAALTLAPFSSFHHTYTMPAKLHGPPPSKIPSPENSSPHLVLAFSRG